MSNPLIQANGGGVGCYDGAYPSSYGNTKFVLSKGGSCGGRIGGFWAGDTWYSVSGIGFGQTINGEAMKLFYKIY